MKRLLFVLPVLFMAAFLQADPKEKNRTPAQKAAYGLCIKRCTDQHKACEKGANALKKASCANNLRVCKNNCEKNY